MFRPTRLAVAALAALAVPLAAQQPRPPEIRRLDAKATVADLSSMTSDDKERSELYKKVAAATARISTVREGIGAGVLIEHGDAGSSFVLTCFHAVETDVAKSTNATFSVGGKPRSEKAKIVAYSAEADLCLLKLDRPIPRDVIAPLKLAAKVPEATNRYLAVGHPSETATGWDVRTGHFFKPGTAADLRQWKYGPMKAPPLLSDAKPNDSDVLVLKLSGAADLYGGFSGAAAVNSSGEVVGVVVGRYHTEGNDKLALAVGLGEVNGMLGKPGGVSALDLTAIPLQKTTTTQAPPPVATLPKVQPPPAPPKNPVAPKHLPLTVVNGLSGINYDHFRATSGPVQYPDRQTKTFADAREPFLGTGGIPESTGLRVATQFGVAFDAPGTQQMREIFDARVGLFACELSQDGQPGISTRVVSVPIGRPAESYRGEDALMRAFNAHLLEARKNLLRFHAPQFDGDFTPPNRAATVAPGKLHDGKSTWGNTFFLDNFSTAWTYRHYSDASAGQDWVVLYTLHGSRFTTSWFEAPTDDLKTEAGRAKHANKAFVLFSQSASPAR